MKPIDADISADELPAPSAAKRSVTKTKNERESRVAHQPAFVLHAYPYKETSLILDVFSRDFGRVALVAKGAKRPHSKLRTVLQTFQPLAMAWVGKSEMKTLTAADWVGGMLPLEKSALLFGFYLNELLIKFLVRDEVSPVLFDLYVSSLNQLAHQEPTSHVLRQFELSLLQRSGLVGVLSECSSTGVALELDRLYVVDPSEGVRPAFASDTIPQILGKTLHDMQRADYTDAVTQMQSKHLMRFLLQYHLHGSPLKTRQILIDLQKL